MESYRKKIEAMIERAREEADDLSLRDSELASKRSDALEEFADALESALEELASEWEK